MAGIRPNSCYRHLERPYTRKSKYKAKAFIKTMPPNKLAKYEFGDLKAKFNCQIDLVTTTPMQIRHNSIESARTVVIRRLTETGKNYIKHDMLCFVRSNATTRLAQLVECGLGTCGLQV